MIRALFASFFALIFTVYTTWPEAAFAKRPALEPLPAVFAVTNIASDDVLNVRAGPSAGSKDIGDLKNGALVEVLRIDTTGQWARIVWGERNAWVARRYLAIKPRRNLPKTQLPADLVCFGTEPFWSFTLREGKNIRFEGLDLQPVTESLDWERVSANHSLRYGIASTSWRALVQKKICSDGMSDTEYGLKIDLMGASSEVPVVLSGCCRIPLDK